MRIGMIHKLVYLDFGLTSQNKKKKNYRKYGAEFKQLIDLIFSTLPMIMRCGNIW